MKVFPVAGGEGMVCLLKVGTQGGDEGRELAGGNGGEGGCGSCIIKHDIGNSVKHEIMILVA